MLATDGSRETSLVQHPADDVLLGWAPDGKRLVFASDRSGTTDAWIIHVDTSGTGGTGYTGVFSNPNSQINAIGRTSFDFTHEVKVEGTYRVPIGAGLNLSALYRYHSGLAWGRQANIPGLWQGPERVRMEPRGTRRRAPDVLIAIRPEHLHFV